MPSRNTAGSRKRSDLSIGAYTVALGADRVPRGADLVADAPHGHDRRGLAELAAQLPHVDVHRAGVTGERVAPDALEQLVARQDEPTVVEQLPEEIELLRRELHLRLPHAYLTPPCVDGEVAVAEHLALDLAPFGSRASQDRLDAGDELARVEGL